jgi:hypothetical protein
MRGEMRVKKNLDKKGETRLQWLKNKHNKIKNAQNILQKKAHI